MADRPASDRDGGNRRLDARCGSPPFGIGVNIAISQIKLAVGGLRSEVRHGHFENSAKLLKTVHDALRGLRTELDIRNESAWGKQLAAIRVEISGLLGSEIEMVPGRVRRLLLLSARGRSQRPQLLIRPKLWKPKP